MRRGLKIIEEANSINLDVYMMHVNEFYEKYFLKNPSQMGKIRKNIFLVTEDLEVLNEALRK